MASPSRNTNQETPLPSMSFVFHPYGDVGPPLMATLSLHGFTIGLTVWLFSSSVIPCTLITSDPNPLSRENQPHVDPSPSSPDVSSPVSTSSPVEICSTSSQVDKKKKKRKIKKKKKKSLNQLILPVWKVLMCTPKDHVIPNPLVGFARVISF